MPRQIILNLLICFVWMFLKNSWSFAEALTGYLLGMLLLFLFRRFFDEPFYMKNIFAIVKLLYIFFRELVKSNVAVTRHVLSPSLNIQPGIFAFPTRLKKNWEITVLANLITLTPGTVVVDISEDSTVLYIHAMNIDDKEKAVLEIQNTFEKAILEVTSGV